MIAYKTDTERDEWPQVDPVLRFLVDLSGVVFTLREGRAWVVTSAVSGPHKDGSLHYAGRAVDLRSNDLPTDRRAWYYSWLSGLMSIVGGLAIWESQGADNEHYHVQLSRQTT